MPTYLPEGCWESIFEKLSHHDFKSVSLVSKQFYSISSNLVFNLKISLSDDQHLLLSQLLTRFTSIKSVHFLDEYCETTRDRSVAQIAHSGLRNLEQLVICSQTRLPLTGIKRLGFANMRSLKKLSCPNVKFMTDSDLSLLSSSLPWLEELDISVYQFHLSLVGPHQVTDQGIAQLAANLPALRRINMSGNKFISDQSLYCLLSSCVGIAEIVCSCCAGITVKCLIDAIRGYSNLISLKFGKFDYVRGNLNCCYLCLTREEVHILATIAEANLPIDKLVIDSGTCTHLHISSVLEFLRELKVIEFRNGSELSNTTFCMLVENCPSLTELEFSSTHLGKKTALVVREKNYTIKTLKLNSNNYLDDETLRRIMRSFPNLEFLEVCNCYSVTEESIRYVLNNCPEIRHLKADGVRLANGSWAELEGRVSELKLEVLSLSYTEIDGKWMDMIAKRCPHLVCLQIEDCSNVTTKDVKELIERCKRLKEVRLGSKRLKEVRLGSKQSCFDFDVVPGWRMVSSISTLHGCKRVVHKLVREMR